jgi:hypothetical protein
MASNRTTQAALTIALSLFVILTFALGVTTYLFFSKRQEADQAQQVATASAAEAQAAMQVTKDEMATLRGIIGVGADMPIADVETGLGQLLDAENFTGDEKSYQKFIAWMRDKVRTSAADVAKAKEEQAAAIAKADAGVKAAEAARDAAAKAETEAKAKLDAATTAFDDKWKGHEAKQGTLLGEKETAERLKKITIQEYLIGRGGQGQMTQRDYGIIGQHLKEQYKYLRGFSEAIATGDMSVLEFERRARMYADAARGMNFEAMRESAKVEGWGWEKRLRRAAESCSPCIGYAAEGWVPLGTLPRPMSQCNCHSNCKCDMIFSNASDRPRDSLRLKGLKGAIAFGWLN